MVRSRSFTFVPFSRSFRSLSRRSVRSRVVDVRSVVPFIHVRSRLFHGSHSRSFRCSFVRSFVRPFIRGQRKAGAASRWRGARGMAWARATTVAWRRRLGAARCVAAAVAWCGGGGGGVFPAAIASSARGQAAGGAETMRRDRVVWREKIGSIEFGAPHLRIRRRGGDDAGARESGGEDGALAAMAAKEELGIVKTSSVGEMRVLGHICNRDLCRLCHQPD